MSHLPMEMQGSFVDGGVGPLMSEDAPGAFRAQGRAFEEIPDWALVGSSRRTCSSTYASGYVPQLGWFGLDG
jgi:hypothetical protein